VGDRVRVCFFVGPSISPGEFRAACAAIDADVVVRPPAQQGDFLRLLSDLPDVIGLIDGFFFQVPAVLHKEILVAMEHGARVLGASSLGALRAAELDAFGMEGIGEVYRLYRDGVIDGDDEVAVLHAEEDDAFRPLTQSMVNLRHNVARALARGVVSVPTAAAVLRRAKRLGFVDRTHAAMLDPVGLEQVTAGELSRLGQFLRHDAVDLKRDDALALVRIVSDRLGWGRSWPAGRIVGVSRTTYLHRYQQEYVGHTVEGEYIPESLVVGYYKVYAPAFPDLFRRIAERCLAVDEAHHRGLSAAAPDVLLAGFNPLRTLSSVEERQRWLRRQHLAHDELVACLTERDLEQRLVRLYRALHPELRGRSALRRRIVADVATRWGVSEQALTGPLLMRPGLPWDGPLLRAMKLCGEFGPALQVAARIQRFSAEASRRLGFLQPAAVPEAILRRWFTTRWGIDELSVDVAIAQRGFSNVVDFVELAGPVYMYERFGQPRSDAPGGERASSPSPSTHDRTATPR
jgi:hypothetical protein